MNAIVARVADATMVPMTALTARAYPEPSSPLAAGLDLNIEQRFHA